MCHKRDLLTFSGQLYRYIQVNFPGLHPDGCNDHFLYRKRNLLQEEFAIYIGDCTDIGSFGGDQCSHNRLLSSIEYYSFYVVCLNLSHYGDCANAGNHSYYYSFHLFSFFKSIFLFYGNLNGPVTTVSDPYSIFRINTESITRSGTQSGNDFTKFLSIIIPKRNLYHLLILHRPRFL